MGVCLYIPSSSPESLRILLYPSPGADAIDYKCNYFIPYIQMLFSPSDYHALMSVLRDMKELDVERKDGVEEKEEAKEEEEEEEQKVEKSLGY